MEVDHRAPPCRRVQFQVLLMIGRRPNTLGPSLYFVRPDQEDRPPLLPNPQPTAGLPVPEVTSVLGYRPKSLQSDTCVQQ